MSKKTNTLLFVIAASLFNIMTFFLVFLALFLLFFMFSGKLVADDGLSSFVTPIFVIIFIAAIGLSFLIYRLVLNFFMRKVNIEDHFVPIIMRRGPQKNQRADPQAQDPTPRAR